MTSGKIGHVITPIHMDVYAISVGIPSICVMHVMRHLLDVHLMAYVETHCQGRYSLLGGINYQHHPLPSLQRGRLSLQCGMLLLSEEEKTENLN